LPPWLRALVLSQLARHGLLPSAGCCAVIRPNGSTGGEPAVGAAAWLEASLTLPLVVGAAPLCLPASVDVCIVNPRSAPAEAPRLTCF
jgi:hypothetical protein